jgi:predicted RNA-binding protein with PIN domain
VSNIKYILVDGYNVINAWEELKDLKDSSLEDARDKLVDMLHDFSAFKGVKIIVVFDAHLVKGSAEKHEKHGAIEVVYTKEGETADCYIERTVVALSKKGGVGVVTSDYLEQRITLQMGGIRITPKEFYIELKHTKNKIRKKTALDYVDQKTGLENHLDKKILEKLEKMRRNL